LLQRHGYVEEAISMFPRSGPRRDRRAKRIVPERIEARLDSRAVEYYEWQVNRIPLAALRRGLPLSGIDVLASIDGE
jgi:hypothetical protein